MQSKDILLDVLHGHTNLLTASIGLTDESPDVAIKPSDLVPVLELYVRGAVNAKYLQEWASWVLSRSEFYVELSDQNGMEAYYEPMWYVLQQLSTPFLDGAITLDVVERHLAVIRSL